MTKSQDDAHESEEVQRRFKALKAALNTPPEHTKDRPRKRSESKPAAKTASC